MAPLVITQGSTDAATIIEPGFPLVLANAITSAQSTAGSTVRSTNPYFTVQPRGDAGDRTLNLNVRGNGGAPTTVNASLYASDDSGSTWQLYQAATGNLVTNSAQALHLVAGLLYQVLASSVTLGGATSVNVEGQLS